MSFTTSSSASSFQFSALEPAPLTRSAHFADSPSKGLGELKPIPPFFHKFSSFSTATVSQFDLWGRLIKHLTDAKVDFTPREEHNQIFCLVDKSTTSYSSFVLTLFACEHEGKQLQPDHQGILVEFQHQAGCKLAYTAAQEDIRAQVLQQPRRPCGLRRPLPPPLPFSIEAEVVDTQSESKAQLAHVEDLLQLVDSPYSAHQREGMTGLAALSESTASPYFALLCSHEFQARVLHAAKTGLVDSCDEHTQRAACYLLKHLCRDTGCVAAVQRELAQADFIQPYLDAAVDQTSDECCKLVRARMQQTLQGLPLTHHAANACLA